MAPIDDVNIDVSVLLPATMQLYMGEINATDNIGGMLHLIHSQMGAFIAQSSSVGTPTCAPVQDQDQLYVIDSEVTIDDLMGMADTCVDDNDIDFDKIREILFSNDSDAGPTQIVENVEPIIDVSETP